MKCLFAMPSELAGDAQSKADEYVAALEKLSPGVTELADAIEAYGEAFAATILKLEDAEWEASKKALAAAGRLGGQVYWTSNDVEQAGQILLRADGEGVLPASRVPQWLSSQARRGRPVILLTR